MGVRGVRVNLEGVGAHDVPTARALVTRWGARVADLGWHVQLYATARVTDALADDIAALPAPVVLDHFALLASALAVSPPGPVPDLGHGLCEAMTPTVALLTAALPNAGPRTIACYQRAPNWSILTSSSFHRRARNDRSHSAGGERFPRAG